MIKKTNGSIKLFYILVFFFSSMLLIGCQAEEAEKTGEDLFEILIFSGLPDSSVEKMKGITNGYFSDESQVDIKLFPPVVERLILEIVGNSGDILIVDRDLLPAIYDSEELHSLDPLRNEENTITLNEFEREAMLANGQMAKGEEFDTFENALRIYDLSLLLPYVDDSGELDDLELVAVIPKYTKDEKLAFTIMEELVN